MIIKKTYQKLQTREGLMLVTSLALVVVTVALVIGWFHRGYRGPEAAGQAPSISVSGQGEVFAVPDVAKFTFTLEKSAATMAEAQKSVTDQGNVLIEKLKAAGIEEKDIQTEGFNTYPKYENRPVTASVMSCAPGSYCPPPVTNSVVTGYTVSHTYSVKVRNLDSSGDIAKLITDSNVSSLNGPDFTVDDMDAVTNQARDKAIADAKEQAEILANQLGVHLRKIVDFQVVNGNTVMPYAAKAMAFGAASDTAERAPAPNIEPGQTDVKVQVTITYRIQ